MIAIIEKNLANNKSWTLFQGYSFKNEFLDRDFQIIIYDCCRHLPTRIVSIGFLLHYISHIFYIFSDGLKYNQIYVWITFIVMQLTLSILDAIFKSIRITKINHYCQFSMLQIGMVIYSLFILYGLSSSSSLKFIIFRHFVFWTLESSISYLLMYL